MARTALVAVALCAVGATVIGVTHDGSSAQISSTGLTEKTPAADAGPTTDVAQVKASLPVLLHRDVATGRLPVNGLAARRAWVTANAGTADVTASLRTVWAAPELAGRAHEWVAALRESAGDPSYEGYDDNRLTVTRWQGVTVAGSTATAVFLGHPGYHLVDGAWRADPDDQYQVALRRTAGAAASGSWRLVSVARIDDSDLAEGGQ